MVVINEQKPFTFSAYLSSEFPTLARLKRPVGQNLKIARKAGALQNQLKLGNLNQNAKRYEARNTEREARDENVRAKRADFLDLGFIHKSFLNLIFEACQIRQVNINKELLTRGLKVIHTNKKIKFLTENIILPLRKY